MSHVHSLISSAPPAGCLAALAAMRDRADSSDMLAGIAVPTLVVVGAEDALISVASHQRLAESTAAAKIEVVPAAGHLTPVEQGEAFNQILAGFLKSID